MYGIQDISRRRFLQVAGVAGASVAFPGLLFGCSDGGEEPAADVDFSDWDAVLAAAAGSEVSWYGWGGDDTRNAWIENYLAPRLKEKYDVTLNLVGMDINDILTQLSGEMQAGAESSAIDFIWINGENFASAKSNGYLWGPFVDYLPNYNEYVDGEAADIAFDFGSPTEGYEAPYGKSQMCLWVDGAVIDDVPKNPDEFLTFCQEHPGQVTYPEPSDFTGTAFISCLIAGVIGKEKFEQLATMADATEDEVRAIVQPGLDYLRSLNPYLWSDGATFPSDSNTVNQMFADGELVFCMGYGDPQSDVDNGTFPATTKTFLFETGTVANTNYMAISANAPHKAAALVAINEIIDPEVQLSAYSELGKISVLDLDKLPEDMKARFDEVPLKSAQVPLDEKSRLRVAEAAGPVIPILEALWLQEVPGK
jgi:putative spermidine/putrescine transport system substrate-binding protein